MNPAIDFPVFRVGRLPAWALGLSLASHLALLGGLFQQRLSVPVDLPPLAVSFRLPAAPAPAVERALLPPRVVAPAPAAPDADRSRTRRPSPAVLAAAGPASGETSRDAALVPAAAAPLPVEPGAAKPPALFAAAKPGGESADAAAMARYIQLLGELFAGQQQYPRLAAARGWQGEVRLRLQVARKGTIVAVHLVHSSGFDVLDQHAVQLVQNATLPPPPAVPSPSPDFLIEIPINYILKRS